MSTTIFKRFFEVRILHGYYLDHWFDDITGKPGLFQEFGTDPNPIIRAQQRKAQQDYVLVNRYNILKDLQIEPTAATRELLDGLKMKWRITPFGIMVGIEVTKVGTGAATQFFPRRMPPANSVWAFTLRSRNIHLPNITNHAMRPTLPGRYHFSNLRAAEDNKTFPSLASRPPDFAASPRTWEMGELSLVAGVLNSANKTTTVQGDFIPVADYNWAHTGDRSALPTLFNYRFDPSLTVTTAEFTLLTAEIAGTVVKTISKDFTQNLPAPAQTAVDFRLLPLPANPTVEQKLHPKPIPDGWYFLKVKVNGVDFERKNVWLGSSIPTQDNALWGIVEISLGQTTPAFTLLNPDNSLKLTQIPGSNPIRWEPPLFEIPFMGRQSYWRYQIDNKFGYPTTDITTYTEVDYNGSGQYIVSKKPRRLSLAPTALSIDPASGTRALPAPDHPELKYDQDQYFSELFLSTIKLT